MSDAARSKRGCAGSASERYHHRHPFNLRMHAGTLTREEIQTWVRNRYYYQTRIPIKDGLILAKAADPAFRREWVQRIHDHDGDAPGEGGLELWLSLADAVGLERGEVERLRRRAARRAGACDDYVRFVESHDLLESVASSLTELFAGDIMQTRIAAFERHYPWVDTAGPALLPEPHAAGAARRGRGPALRARARAAARRTRSAAPPRSSASARSSGACSTRSRRRTRARASRRTRSCATRRGELLIVLPERAVKPSASGREILALCDGERSAVEIAEALRERHPDVSELWRATCTTSSRACAELGVLDARARRRDERAAPLQPRRRADLPLPAALRLLLEPGRRSATSATRSTAPPGRACSARPRRSASCTWASPAASRARAPISRESSRGAAEAGLYTHLVTAGTTLSAQGLAALRAAGLRSVQLSIQDAQAAASDAHRRHGRASSASSPSRAAVRARGPAAHAERRAAPAQSRARARADRARARARRRAARARERAVRRLGAREPRRAAAVARAARRGRAGRGARRAARRRAPRSLCVLPDYFAIARSRAWAAGDGARSSSRPDGRVLPCHAAARLPGLEFWNVPAQSLARVLERRARHERVPRRGLDAASRAAAAPSARATSAAAAARPSR